MNYQETPLSGTAWTRCHQLVIDNPLGGTPTVRFDEQEVMVFGERSVTKPIGTLAVPFDPAAVIALRDPTTGEPTGETTTYGAAYAVLYSAYMDAAMARDTPPAAPAEPTV